MLNFDGEFLCCPVCGGTNVHVDDAYVAGRPREDGDVHPVHVDKAGQVTSGVHVVLPERPKRRHLITLAGRCEGCTSGFGITFEQHKGTTIVRTLKKSWGPIQP